MKNNRLLYLLIIILTIWCIVLTTMVTNKTDEVSNQIINEVEINGFSTDFTKIINEKSSSIVSINANGTIGSGFVYKQDGEDIYILSAYHTIADANSYYVYFANGMHLSAALIDKNIYADLALLQVKSPYNIDTLKLADSTLLKAGEFVVSIGTPISLEYDNSVELGMISNPLRTVENSITVLDEKINYNLDVIQLSSNLKPGFSGSPLLNMAGEVVGMVTMSLKDGYNFAITSNEIKLMADRMIAGQKIVKYQLGIMGSYIKDMPMFEKSNLNISVETINGLYVEKLIDNCAALNAGVKVGDVILSINGVELNTMSDYLNVVYNETQNFEFLVLRDGQTILFRIEIND